MSKGRAYAPMCKHEQVHEQVVERSRGAMPDEATVYELADFFKVLGDSTRMRLLIALEQAPMCVCDLAAVLGMTKSAVSHQLKTLRQNQLVSYRRAGKNVIYTLADGHVRLLLDTALEHITEAR